MKLLSFLFLLVGITGRAVPTVLITNLPPYASTGNLGGLVTGVEPAEYKVAVFIFVPGYGWVTKPNCAQPLTNIRPDGSWSADITTGGSDPQATRVAALLVSTNFNQPCVQGAAFLTNAFAAAQATAVVTRPYPGPRWIHFSGYDWWVKNSVGRVRPGPNYFSDSTNNVWVDDLGQLHLRLTNRSNQWQCAELVSARTFGYGSYRFELNSRVDNLNPSVVLGLFTWSDDPAYAHREIDFEASRWSNPADANNCQFVVQPWDTAGHLVRFFVPPLTNTTQVFLWQTNRVTFQAERGPFSPEPGTNLIYTWTYNLAAPRTGDENVRLNLWLNAGTAPTDSREVEVIIKSFVFAPAGAPVAALLTNASLADGKHLTMQIVTEPDRRYVIQSSDTLETWEDSSILLATNVITGFEDPNPVRDRRFYRSITLP